MGSRFESPSARGIMSALLVSITVDTTYTRSTNVVCRQVGAESILVPIRNHVGDLGAIFVLTPVAARIWSLLDGVSVDAIVDTLCSEFDVDRDTASADVTELLDALQDAALVKMVEA
jgi:hypothetical protein